MIHVAFPHLLPELSRDFSSGSSLYLSTLRSPPPSLPPSSASVTAPHAHPSSALPLSSAYSLPTSRFPTPSFPTSASSSFPTSRILPSRFQSDASPSFSTSPSFSSSFSAVPRPSTSFAFRPSALSSGSYPVGDFSRMPGLGVGVSSSSGVSTIPSTSLPTCASFVYPAFSQPAASSFVTSALPPAPLPQPPPPSGAFHVDDTDVDDDAAQADASVPTLPADASCASYFRLVAYICAFFHKLLVCLHPLLRSTLLLNPFILLLLLLSPWLSITLRGCGLPLSLWPLVRLIFDFW